MTPNCPVNFKSINSRLIRAYAATIFMLLITLIIFNLKWVSYILLLDFFLRMSWGIKGGIFCSPLNRLLYLLKIKEQPVNALPKQFAVKVGFIFSFLLVLFNMTGIDPAFWITVYIFTLAVGLEVFFNFCLACKMYEIYFSVIKKRSSKNEGIFK